MVSLKGQSLLGLQGMPKEKIDLILRVAKKMKEVVNRDDKKLPFLHEIEQANKPYANGFIVSELCDMPSNWQNEGTLSTFIMTHHIPWRWN